jgi:hypothetical protein
MAKTILPPNQSDVDEATLDGVRLVQQLGFQLDADAAKRVAGRKAMLLTSASFLSLMFVYTEPIIDGWKKAI